MDRNRTRGARNCWQRIAKLILKVDGAQREEPKDFVELEDPGKPWETKKDILQLLPDNGWKGTANQFPKEEGEEEVEEVEEEEEPECDFLQRPNQKLITSFGNNHPETQECEEQPLKTSRARD